jgi:Cas7 group CRISPR-associated protein Csh2
MTTEDVLKQYWDCRVFGTNFLSKKGSHINSGAVQFGLGTSIAPVKLLSFTHTKCCGAEAGLDRGMAPKGYKVVQHGLYVIPFFVNPTSAKKSNCTETDIEVFKRLIPYIFTHSISRSRNRVSIQNAWYVDLGSPLGCFNPVSIVDQLTPTKKTDPGVPSSSISEYTIPLALPKEASKSGATLQSLV